MGEKGKNKSLLGLDSTVSHTDTVSPSLSSSSSSGNGGGGSGRNGGSGVPLNKQSPEATTTTENTTSHLSPPLSGGIRIEEGESIGGGGGEGKDEKRVHVEEGLHRTIDRSKLKNLKKSRSRGSVLNSSFIHSGFSAG